VTCIPRKEKIKKEKNKHPTIIKVSDGLWDNQEYSSKGETSQNGW